MNPKFINAVFNELSFGIVLVDFQHRILGANRRFCDWFVPSDGTIAETSDAPFDAKLAGRDFYRTIGFPYFLDGDYCPLHSVRTSGRPTRSVVSDVKKDVRYELFASSAVAEDGSPACLVEMKEIDEKTNVEQMLHTLQKAGAALTNIADRYLAATPSERMRLLSSQIQEHMCNVLKYDVFEIRLLDEETSSLKPLLAFGMNPDAAQRELKASPGDNGITGFVADSGEVYFCDDTKNDYLYLPGAIDARSSLTVPIVYHDRVIGVCNVESETANAFTKQDAVFLQLYAKDLAIAFRMLDLISSEGEQMKRFCGSKIRDELYESSNAAVDLAFSLLDETKYAEKTENSADDSASFRVGLAARLARNVLSLKTKINSLKKRFLNQQTSETPPFLSGRLSRSASSSFGVGVSGTTSTAATLFADDKIGANGGGTRVCASENVAVFSPINHLVQPQREEKQIRDLLRNRRVLIVEHDLQVARMVAEYLETFACSVDSVCGTKAALQLLQTEQYDLVVSDLFPDGSILGEYETTAVGNSCNKFQRSVVDFHLENYFVPAENDPVDAEKRREIYREIYVNRKLDGFFFKQKIDKLQLDKNPAFVLTSASTDYDPTHVQRHLSEIILKRKVALFTATNLSFVTTARVLAQELAIRDAEIQKKERQND